MKKKRRVYERNELGFMGKIDKRKIWIKRRLSLWLAMNKKIIKKKK